MKIYDTAQFEKLNINPINSNILNNIEIVYDFIEFDLTKLKLNDLENGDAFKTKNDKTLVFLMQRYAYRIMNLGFYEKEHYFFVRLSDENKFIFIPGSYYGMKFPKINLKNDLFNLVKMIRPTIKLDLEKWNIVKINIEKYSN